MVAGSVVLLAIGLARWWSARQQADLTGWTSLYDAIGVIKKGGDSTACLAVADGAPRLNCLLYAADHALHANDLTALRATCERMPDQTWKESCLLDAIDIDPALDLVGTVAACESETPALAYHCEGHVRNRMKLFPREIALAPEVHPEQMVGVFNKLVYDHTVPENEETAQAFGKRLHTFGRPIDDCGQIDASLQAKCRDGYGQ